MEKRDLPNTDMREDQHQDAKMSAFRPVKALDASALEKKLIEKQEAEQKRIAALLAERVAREKEQKQREMDMNRPPIEVQAGEINDQRQAKTFRSRKPVLEQTLRKIVAVSLGLSLLLAGISLGIAYTLSHYHDEELKTRDVAKQEGKEQFIHRGLQGTPLASEALYQTNEEKIRARVLRQKQVRSKSAQGKEASSEQDSAPSADRTDLKARETNAKRNANYSGSDALDAAQIPSQEEAKQAADSGDYQALALLPNPPSDLLSKLFDRGYYEDVLNDWTNRSTMMSVSEAPNGLTLHYPYLTLYAPYTWPLLPTSPKVSEAFFDDAAFIGDSILSIFTSSMSFDADNFARPNMRTMTALDNFVFTNSEGETGTIRELLTLKQYGKLFFLLGTNESAYGDPNIYWNAYREMLTQVRALQPRAQFYLITTFPVSAYYEEEGRYPSNEDLTEMNAGLADICQEFGAFLLDPGASMRGEYGVLPDGVAEDGIHFSAAEVPDWQAYMQTHTYQGALGLLDPKLAPESAEEADLQTEKEASKQEQNSADEREAMLDQLGIPVLGEDGELQKKEEVKPGSASARRLAREQAQLEAKKHKRQNAAKQGLATPEEGQNVPSTKAMHQAYEAVFTGSDDKVKSWLDELYQKVIEQIAFQDKMSSIRPKSILSLYGFSQDELEDARILRSTQATAEELLLLCFKDEDAALDARQKLLVYLRERIKTYQDYAPAELDRLKKASPIRDGRWLYLVIADRSDRLEQLVK